MLWKTKITNDTERESLLKVYMHRIVLWISEHLGKWSFFFFFFIFLNQNNTLLNKVTLFWRSFKWSSTEGWRLYYNCRTYSIYLRCWPGLILSELLYEKFYFFFLLIFFRDISAFNFSEITWRVEMPKKKPLCWIWLGRTEYEILGSWFTGTG